MERFEKLSLDDRDNEVGVGVGVLGAGLGGLCLGGAVSDAVMSDADADVEMEDVEMEDVQSDTQESLCVSRQLSSDDLSSDDLSSDDDDVQQDTNTTTPLDVAKLLLSPVQLGESLVSIQSNNNNNTTTQQTIRQQDVWKQLLSDKQLINVNINNHNYFNNGESVGDQIEGIDPLDHHHPPSWYNTISSIQYTINIGSIIILSYLLIASFLKDLKSIWYQNKLLLINESENCKLQYNLNNCHLDRNLILPDMIQICQYWNHCANRNNNKIWQNRTSLLINFIINLINQLLINLNWKSFLIILISIWSWFFITNLSLSFIKSILIKNNNKTLQDNTLLQDNKNLIKL